MKVYLAAPYGEMLAQREIAEEFQKAGHEITSRWIFGGEIGQSREFSAVMDVNDVDAADVLVLKTYPRGTQVTGGGRHFEFGYAFAQQKRCIVVGEAEHVFCCLPGVKSVATYTDAIAELG